ncbi:MAG: AMP-binding protein [Lachnospiraceae bacterium]|nr:AMP-binding protein [Lachnospiraceae bacterium]
MQNHVLDYLFDIVKKVPNKVAYSDGTVDMTFQDVYNEARSVASFLHNNGVYREAVVIFMKKQPKTIAAFFGTIMGRNYYVPIDSEMPAVRMQLILENVKPKFVICDDDSIESAKSFKFDGKIINYDDIKATPHEDEALNEIYSKTIDTDPIYIVFTSGSTGIPKGVVACHRSVIDYIEQLSDVMKVTEDTIFGSQTPLYVDACLKELYPTIKFGATTYLIPKELFMFPIDLVKYLNEHKVNTICWVVSALTMVSAFGAFKTVVPEYLHTICFGSEVFPIKQFNIWKSVAPNARFINLYGPTEGTGMCCYYEVNRDFELDEVIPIGNPFKNTEIILLDGDNKEANEGEICIRGTSVTLGYFNNPEKTSECFVQNPLNPYYPEIIYRTGDIGKYNEYGELQFVSRKDYQIKHMGHRIELGEIEINVNMMDEINMAGCIYDEIKNKIVLYYVGDMEIKDLTMDLKSKLPRYMIPNSIIKLDKMPLTTNGKMDRAGLKKMYQNK